MSKFYPKNHIIGQKGVNLLERRVLEMGSVWNATGLEAGIDGYIELADPSTGEALNQLIPVQVKSTEGSFTRETPETFEFLCDERDLEYWLIGNAPVVLAVTRPSSGEVYWVSIRDQFATPERRAARRAFFDKQADRLDGNAFHRLLNLASSLGGRGIYLSPPPQPETLRSNLLPLIRVPPLIYVAETEFSSRREIWSVVEDDGELGNAWTIRDSVILSFRDLETPKWRTLCNVGTLDAIETDHWSKSSSRDLQRTLVELLNLALTEALERLDVRWLHREGLHYFLPSPGQYPDRLLRYKSLSQKTQRHVVKCRRQSGESERFRWVRHSALRSSFRRLEGDWYLELGPTYYFTTDGRRPHPRSGDLVSGQKRYEHNASVLGQTIMWARILGGHADPTFALEDAPLLGFGDLKSFAIHVGIDDERWLRIGDDDPKPESARTLQMDALHDLL